RDRHRGWLPVPAHAAEHAHRREPRRLGVERRHGRGRRVRPGQRLRAARAGALRLDREGIRGGGEMIPYRRRLPGAGLALPFAADGWAQSCARTLAQTEGPFFKTGTPLRTSFLEKGAGTRLVVTGQVLSAGCRPVANALLEFWHADELGEYDNQGYRYRGHQHADAQGRYRL